MNRHIPTFLAVVAGTMPPANTAHVLCDGVSENWLRIAALGLAIVLHILQARREQRRERRRNRASRK